MIEEILNQYKGKTIYDISVDGGILTIITTDKNELTFDLHCSRVGHKKTNVFYTSDSGQHVSGEFNFHL